jgi:hypothetical protein
MTTRLTVLPFLNLLRRGVTIDVHAEAGDERFLYVTSTEILDSRPDGEGGVVLTLHATTEDGRLNLPEAVIATAQEGLDGWKIRHGGLVFRFGLAEAADASSCEPGGSVAEPLEEWEAHTEAVREREERRDANLREQTGR